MSDLPLVSEALIRSLAAANPLAAVVVVSAGGRLHPTLARYHPSATESLAAALDSGRRLTEIVRAVGAESLEVSNRQELLNVNAPEDLPAAGQGTLLQRFAAAVYANYVLRQTWLFPRTVDLLRQLRRVHIAPSFRAAYRERQQPLLPLCSWLGQNIRFALLGFAGIAGHPSAYLWTEVLAMNLLLFVVLQPSHEANSGALSTALEREASAY